MPQVQLNEIDEIDELQEKTQQLARYTASDSVERIKTLDEITNILIKAAKNDSTPKEQFGRLLAGIKGMDLIYVIHRALLLEDLLEATESTDDKYLLMADQLQTLYKNFGTDQQFTQLQQMLVNLDFPKLKSYTDTLNGIEYEIDFSELGFAGISPEKWIRLLNTPAFGNDTVLIQLAKQGKNEKLGFLIEKLTAIEDKSKVKDTLIQLYQQAQAIDDLDANTYNFIKQKVGKLIAPYLFEQALESNQENESLIDDMFEFLDQYQRIRLIRAASIDNLRMFPHLLKALPNDEDKETIIKDIIDDFAKNLLSRGSNNETALEFIKALDGLEDFRSVFLHSVTNSKHPGGGPSLLYELMRGDPDPIAEGSVTNYLLKKLSNLEAEDIKKTIIPPRQKVVYENPFYFSLLHDAAALNSLHVHTPQNDDPFTQLLKIVQKAGKEDTAATLAFRNFEGKNVLDILTCNIPIPPSKRANVLRVMEIINTFEPERQREMISKINPKSFDTFPKGKIYFQIIRLKIKAADLEKTNKEHAKVAEDLHTKLTKCFEEHIRIGTPLIEDPNKFENDWNKCLTEQVNKTLGKHRGWKNFIAKCLVLPAMFLAAYHCIRYKSLYVTKTKSAEMIDALAASSQDLVDKTEKSSNNDSITPTNEEATSENEAPSSAQSRFGH